MEPLGNIGGWDLAYDGGEPHAATQDYFLATAQHAWAALTGGAAQAIGIHPDHLTGTLTLMPFDTEPNKGSAGWYRHSDDKAVVLYRRGMRTSGGADPERHYGILPQGSMVASITHEMAHRTWYRLRPAARALWAEFVYTLGEEFTEEELLGMAREAEATSGGGGEPLWRSLGVPPRDLLRASVQLGPAQRLIADTFWWWYSDEHKGATPLDYHRWLQGKKYSKMLPTSYAKRAPVEAWPDAIADLVLYGGKMARTTHRLLAGVVKRVLASHPSDTLEMLYREEPADLHVVPEARSQRYAAGASSLDRARARVLQLGG